MASQAETDRQTLYLVFGGELVSTRKAEFRDLSALDVVGIFPDFAAAERAWRAKAQETVDSAATRYFIVHLHEFLDPDGDGFLF
ncbi:hypothetical protein PB2503_06727 [Parvularcula bermudensis HTCC2503]|uniref:DUF4170 domain-containing protein n=1 Tax=Parvularcula bermudensis (strain ATCC BAA-594 / HTCC2503 / KCTC 12087) TaxID=314260 RepID=E0TI72_PARBH|nr:DUF4170 domain-containing protein [Parvularcula bermudensis]ADM09411.1 hypothetical protein PB2503_06727 [Parvularcula bermudensis HTCC2503]